MLKKIILLAEDIEQDAFLTLRALRQAGVANRVINVTNGKDAMDYLKGEGVFANREEYPFPAVVLLDLKLPRVSGFEILDWLHQHPPREPFVAAIVTGYSNVSRAKNCAVLGAKYCFVKPCGPEDFQALIHSTPELWELEGAPVVE